MQLLQIDTIHVVARSPYLTLFSRVGAYPMTWLEDLLETGRIAECWAHEACFVPAADYPLHRAALPLRQNHWAHRHARRVHAEYPQQMQRLLDHVREHGAVRSADFARGDGGGAGWWEWKPEKRWLEAWFALGELMVARRERFQRVYDLTARVRAAHGGATPAPDSPQAARRDMLLRSVLALGVTQARWIADYFRLARVREAELQALCASGDLLAVEVRGWDAPGYVHRSQRELMCRAAAGRLRATHTTLLSPFDPVLWDRARVRVMFDFDYTLECYVPAARRRHGYFVLPVLHGGRLVARLDAKAHRAQGEFEVKSIHLEPQQTVSAALVAALAKAIGQFARWHGTPAVRVVGSEPRQLAEPLRAALRADARRAAS